MYSSIPEVFLKTAGKHLGKTALLYKKQGVFFPITYKEFAEKVLTFAFGLKKLGVSKGEKIAILSENRPEWAIADLAIMSVGCIVVPLHTTLNSKALLDILNHSKSKILIVSNNDLLNKILLFSKKLRHIKKVIFLEKITASQKKIFKSKIVTWNAVLNSAGQKKLEKIYLKANQPCSIIYTSGTTGKPKGAVLTHKNFLSNAEAVNKVVPVKETDIFLSFLPLSHVLERLAGHYMPLCFGATIAYAESTKQLPQNLKEVKPTILIAVPRIFEKFHDAVWDKVNSSSKFQKNFFLWALKQKKGTLAYKAGDLLVFQKIRRQMGGRLRLTISGGASLNENIGKFFSKIGITILEGYGLTETSPVIAVNRENETRFGTVGRAIPGVEVKISETKQILVKGPNVFGGYFNDKKQTKECFDKQGWFYTGDLGFVDAQGCLTIIGRKKEMIVTSGGKNIWPEKIENLLNDDKFISQSMVIGAKKKFVSALIVPDWQEVEIYMKKNKLPLKEHQKLANDPRILAVFQERMNKKINPKLNEYEKIKKFLLIPQEFSQKQNELTPTLKLRRHIVEKHYQKGIKKIYAGD